MQSDPTAAQVLAEIREVVRQALSAPARIPQPQIEPFLTVDQVAELLSVSSKTVRGWVETRRIPHYKPGARPKDKVGSRVGVRFRASDLEAWLETVKVDEIGEVQISTLRRMRRA